MTPTFQWQSVSGADGYGLYISVYSGGSWNLIFDSDSVYGGPISGTSLVLPSGYLNDGGQYRWNMRSHNSADWGSFSGHFYFTVSTTSPLPPPTLSSPPNGGGNQLTTPTFIWSSVTGATSYRIMIATDRTALPTDPSIATCPNCTLNETPSSTFYIPPVPLSAGTTYWWQVHARSVTNYGTWSSQWSFTTAGAQPPPTASFTWSPSSPQAGQSIQFIDTSTGSPTSWSWSFGDGYTSSAKNPSHTYGAAGTYTVRLTATNQYGSNTSSRSLTVAASGSKPTASFTWSPSSPKPDQSVQFTDTSTGSPTSWSWSFGDGYTSSTRNPSHTYGAAGTYTVRLTATNQYGSSTSSRSLTVAASGSKPTASFTWSPSSPKAGQSVQFTDTSTGGPTSWSWDFSGDGVEDSSEQNPKRAFAGAGPHPVMLVSRNAAGESLASATVNVVDRPGIPVIKTVTRQYPGVFLQGEDFTHRFDVAVDWQGNPGNVTFSINGGTEISAAGDATGASHAFDMTKDFPARWDPSVVSIIATNSNGASSAPVQETVYVFPYPAWLQDVVDQASAAPTTSAAGQDVVAKISLDYPKPHRRALIQDIPSFIPVFGNHPLGLVDEGVSGTISISSALGGGDLDLRGSGVMTAASVDYHYSDVRQGGYFTLQPPEGLRLQSGYYQSGFSLKPFLTLRLTDWFPFWDKVKLGLNVPFLNPIVRWLEDSFKLRIPLEIRYATTATLQQDTTGNIIVNNDKKTNLNISLSAIARQSCIPALVVCREWVGGSVASDIPFQDGSSDRFTIGIEAGISVTSKTDFFAHGCAWTWVGCSVSSLGSFECPTPHIYFEEDCADRYAKFEVGSQVANGAATRGGHEESRSESEGRLVIRHNYGQFGKYCALGKEPDVGCSRAMQSPSLDSSDTEILSNVFPGAMPTVLELPQGKFFLFAYQRPELPVLQSTELAWSRSTGSGWSAAAMVTHDTQADSFPAAGVDAGGRVVAVWLRVRDPRFSESVNSMADIQHFLTRFDVVSAVFDPATSTWSTIRKLTDDDSADYAVRVSSDGNGHLMASWLSNPTGAVFSTADGPARLRCAFWDGKVWTSAVDVATDLVGVYGYAAAFRGDRAILVVGRQPHSENPMGGVLDVYEWNGRRWNMTGTLGAVGTDNRSPTLAYDSSGRAWIVWLRNNDLVSAIWPDPVINTVRHGSRSLAFLETGLYPNKRGQLVVVWAEPSDDSAVNLYARILDATSLTWSSDIRLNKTPFEAHDFTGYFGRDGVLSLAYLATSVNLKDVTLTGDSKSTTIHNVPEEGRTDLRLLEHSLTTDLAVQNADLRLAPRQPLADSSATATLTVHNVGDFPVGEFDVDFYVGDPTTNGVLVGSKTVAEQLAAGDNVEVVLDFSFPDARGDLVAVVDPYNQINEFSENNNEATYLLTNRPPEARVAANVTTGIGPLAVRFDASSSSDPDGDAMTFTWLFFDGSAESAGPAVKHTFTLPGKYPVVVFVRDSHGAVGTATVTITVQGPGANINTPSLSAPAEADGGLGYTVACSPTSPCNAYEIQEDISPLFQSPTIYTIVGTSHRFIHPVLSISSFYYRVRALAGCSTPGLQSEWSSLRRVEVRPSAMAAPDLSAAGPFVHVVPAAAHIVGVADTNWVSELVLHNLSDVSAHGAAYFLRGGQDNATTRGAAFSLGPRQDERFTDVVRTMFGETASSGALLIGSDQPLLITSRTYNNASSGTYGQFIAGMPLGEAIGANQTVRLIQLTRNGDYRTNIGFANASGKKITVKVKLYRSNGSSIATRSYTVEPYGFYQKTDPIGTNVSDAYALLSSATLGAKFFTYASVIDQRTGDPVFITPRAGTASAGQSLYIPGSAHATGAGGTQWRTDVEIHNPGSTTASYRIELLKRDHSNPSPQSRTYNLSPGHSVRYTDALSLLFGFTGAAALRITPSSGTIMVTSRTYNQTSKGTFGQFIPAVPASAAIGSGDTVPLIQLSDSASTTSGYRTNIGFVNTSNTTITARADLYDASGSKLGTKTVSLQAYEYKQVARIFRSVTSQTLNNCYAVLSTSTSGGSFLAYGSVVDNRSGDPVYVPATVTGTAGGGGGGGGGTCSITVTSPNGGESWELGSTHSVKWTKSGTACGSKVKAELLEGSQVVSTIRTDTPNDGALSWDIATNLTAASNYRVRLTDLGETGASDVSDGYFSLTGEGGGATITITLPGGVKMELVHIPAGTFMMGSPWTERGRTSNETQHSVTLTKGFFIGKYEVTQAQWQAVMGHNPAHFTACGGDCPVENVSWNEICGGSTGSDCTSSSFIGRLNAYLTTTKFRLPTEAEWEYAARAGTNTPFFFGDDTTCRMDDCSSCDTYANNMWWCGNADNTTHPIGQKRANPWGLFDVHGNVWELVGDWWGAYVDSPETDPTGPTSGTTRVIRGGSWLYQPQYCRSAYRYSTSPNYAHYNIGFRLARSE